MKNLFLTLILLAMFLKMNAQKIVYNDSNKKLCFKKEKSELILLESKIKIPNDKKLELNPITSLIPTAIDLGFKLVTDGLEKRKKKFSGEYSNQNSYLKAGSKSIADLEFKREILINQNFEKAFELKLKAVEIDNLPGFYYYVECINLKYSKAKTTNKSRMFDYTIEIKPTFFIGGEKKSQNLRPIKLTSIEFGSSTFQKDKYRTDIIPLPKNAFFADISIKIVETNPAKVKADKVFETFNTYKDEAKTIINNFIKTEQSKTAKNSVKTDNKDAQSNE